MFACHEGGYAAAAADGLALVRGVCECVMAAPPPALAKALCRLARDDAAIALREDALRCLASLFASCAAREGAVLVLLDAGLADAVAGALGGGKREGAAEPNAAEADAREPDATDAGPGSPPSASTSGRNRLRRAVESERGSAKSRRRTRPRPRGPARAFGRPGP